MQDKSDASVPIANETELAARYDAAQSFKLKHTPLPQYIEDIRHKNPQGTIDYLFVRKEAYKAAALRHYTRANETEKKLKEATEENEKVKKELKETKAKNRQELNSTKTKHKEAAAMVKWWKYVCLAVGIAAVVLIVLVMFITQLMIAMNKGRPEREAVGKMPVSGKVQKSGNHVLASVNIYNGSTQGSGVVISKGDKYAALLSAGHNFKGKLGGTVWVYYADGTYTKATLLALDRDRDLALLRVDKSTIIGHSYIPKRIFEGDLCGVGYTEGQGPNYRKLTYNRAYYNTQGKYMWDFSVSSGPFWDGDSGSGVFIDDACVGITSQRDAKVYTNNNTFYKRLYACSHDEILRFLKAHAGKLDGCGDYHERPPSHVATEDAPPLWKPSPNVPVYTESRVERMVEELREEVDKLKRGEAMKRPSEVPEKDKKDDKMKRPSEIKD